MENEARGMLPEHNLNTAYRPVAIYYDASDSIEYVRSDVPCVYERVDEMLTLVLRMSDNELVGFRVKGFRNFYQKEIKEGQDYLNSDFVLAVSVLEKMMGRQCNKLFEDFDDARRSAYQQAWGMARQDQVELHDLPLAA